MMPFAAGDVVAGRYTLERALGRGATATVWLVRDGRTGETLAMKVLSEELSDARSRERFAREIRRTAALDHARIVPVLDAGEFAETLYFTQPYMPGGTLRQRLERERQLAVPEALRIGRDLAGALAHAHAKGFVHRDVKPENILFAEGDAYLADFGISQAIEASADETTQSRLLVRGTLPYMSPEQASGLGEVDGRSDLFSLGAVLYECLTGIAAFQGATPDVIMAQVIGAEPRPIAELRPKVSPDVVQIIGTCLAKTPADRFQEAAALALALANPERRRVTPSGEHAGGQASGRTSADATASADPDRRDRRRRLLWGGLVAASAIAVAATLAQPSRWSDPGIPLDTTRLLLFPIDVETPDTLGGGVDDELMRAAFQRADGITLVPKLIVDDRLAQGEEARRARGSGRWVGIAGELRAGRFVRGRITGRRDRRRAEVALVDTRSGEPLFERTFALPAEPSAAEVEWSRTAAMLLLRSTTLPEGTDAPRIGWSIPALQSYAQGHAALKQWDLALADSLFERAQAIEPDDPSTQFWLAQVRAWARQSRSEWSGLAARAAERSSRLPARERQLARALDALGAQDFDRACAGYRALIRSDSMDFAGWFGLGQCHAMDALVVPDRTPGGDAWRFRSSHQQAFASFERALRLLPTIHKGIQREGFDKKSLYVMRASEIRLGAAADGRRFGGRLAWRGDSLVMVPVPLEVLAAGGPEATPPGFEEALRRQRNSFRAMARTWSTHFPKGSEAKEAVALALELNGVPSAIDTVRLARSLAASDRARHELALIEARLLFRFGFPDDLAALRRLRALADSLLDGPARRELGADEALEVLAIVRRRCDDALRITRGREGVENLGLPNGPAVESREVLDQVVMRCAASSEWTRTRDLRAHLEDEPVTRDPAQRPHLLRSFLLRPVLMMTRRDPTLARWLADELPDPILRSAAALDRGDREAARAALVEFDGLADPSLPMSPDYAYMSARLWADVGDTARALARLDGQFTRIRMADPFYFREPGNLGALLLAAMWRGQLAMAAGDGRTARRWQEAIAVLQGR